MLPRILRWLPAALQRQKHSGHRRSWMHWLQSRQLKVKNDCGGRISGPTNTQTLRWVMPSPMREGSIAWVTSSLSSWKTRCIRSKSILRHKGVISSTQPSRTPTHHASGITAAVRGCMNSMIRYKCRVCSCSVGWALRPKGYRTLWSSVCWLHPIPVMMRCAGCTWITCRHLLRWQTA